ncbi:hypothetical protein Agub_g12134 [Astrephomene gubernaculifera]|uniref:EGF-like domain-containing protein n=1 Tax=Astrephomene gubernaculifera TaxID=47775 RepID=A0AAD3E0G4_9CHLO|nr:hypothetical protein Agub_g12134 [Astrephomene gubernaculifera]
MVAERILFRLLPLVALLGLALRLRSSVSPAVSHHGLQETSHFGQMVGVSGVGRSLLQDDENDKHSEDEVALLVMKLNRSSLLPLPVLSEQRCAPTKGVWCAQFHGQTPAPRYLPKYYNKPCPNNCSGVGVCHAEYGMCFCPAGYGGPDCAAPRKRPCAHMGTDKRDAGWHNLTTWSHTRCAGVCDDDIAMCYCPPDTKYGRKEAPPGSPLGSPPLQAGRPLFMCTPGTDSEGRKVEWGGTPFPDMFGPAGWCNADKPNFTCPCRLDGLHGPLCDVVSEQVCPNQCSGRGRCNQGFCACQQGWYGVDCALRREGVAAEEQGLELLTKQPWLPAVRTHIVATEDPPLTPVRRRPYVYVYDMKPEYGSDLLQYRIEGSHCVYRTFKTDNTPDWVGYNAYSTEPVLHELFLASEHRTLDPEEADFFFVPVNVGCMLDVYGWNEVPRWPKDVHGPRSHGLSLMQREAQRWLNATFPWFARRGGRDHIWFNPHDEGACYVWKDVWPGVMLSHWGRTDFPHLSHTAYGQDNYSMSLQHPEHPGDWLDHTSRTHPCFDPKKDLVIPAFKPPRHYHKSPYLGAPPPAAGRDIFAFFMGDLRMQPGRDPDCIYSRCIRQTLYNLSISNHWKEAHAIWYGERKDVAGSGEDYSELLARSTFCFVLPGDGWSPRLEDAVLHGCIPVIIMDDVQVVFESIIDVEQFSVRILQRDIPNVVDILKRIPPTTVKTMQEKLHKVWHRFRFLGLRMARAEARKLLEAHQERAGGSAPRHPGAEYSIHAQDDAFDTLMQWLYSRIPSVHSGSG